MYTDLGRPGDTFAVAGDILEFFGQQTNTITSLQ